MTAPTSCTLTGSRSLTFDGIMISKPGSIGLTNASRAITFARDGQRAGANATLAREPDKRHVSALCGCHVHGSAARLGHSLADIGPVPYPAGKSVALDWEE